MIPPRFVAIVAVGALAAAVWALLRLCSASRHGDNARAAHLARVCVAVWFVGLLGATMGGRPRDATAGVFINWVPFATQTLGYEILANLFLFSPLGMFMPWLLRPGNAFRVLAVSFLGAALLSSAIECVQALTPLGTAGDMTDVILNTAGCAVTAVCAGFLHRRVQGDTSLEVVPLSR